MFLVKDTFVQAEFAKKTILSFKGSKLSTVINKKGKSLVKPNQRKSLHLEIESTYHDLFKNRLQALIPELIQKFDRPIDSLSKLDFIKYEVGHYFQKHRDTGDIKQINNRALTAIIYLNSCSKYNNSADSFQGGDLILYGTHKDFPNHGLPIFPKTGRLLVFPSELFHEVKPIINGTRYCMVAWYLK